MRCERGCCFGTHCALPTHSSRRMMRLCFTLRCLVPARGVIITHRRPSRGQAGHTRQERERERDAENEILLCVCEREVTARGEEREREERRRRDHRGTKEGGPPGTRARESEEKDSGGTRRPRKALEMGGWGRRNEWKLDFLTTCCPTARGAKPTGTAFRLSVFLPARGRREERIEGSTPDLPFARSSSGSRLSSLQWRGSPSMDGDWRGVMADRTEQDLACDERGSPRCHLSTVAGSARSLGWKKQKRVRPLGRCAVDREKCWQREPTQGEVESERRERLTRDC
ncbi:hypothetical protein V8E36_000356 [Tilletia maclaganii]